MNVKSPSAYPWRLTARIGTIEETKFYSSRKLALPWVRQFIRKHYTVQLHKYEHGGYVERVIPAHIIQEAQKEAY